MDRRPEDLKRAVMTLPYVVSEFNVPAAGFLLLRNHKMGSSVTVVGPHYPSWSSGPSFIMARTPHHQGVSCLLVGRGACSQRPIFMHMNCRTRNAYDRMV
jgi:hypothetical protein